MVPAVMLENANIRSEILADVLRLCRPFIVAAVIKQRELGIDYTEDFLVLERIDKILGDGLVPSAAAMLDTVKPELQSVIEHDINTPILPHLRQSLWPCPTCKKVWLANPMHVGQQCQECGTWRKSE